MIKEQVRSVRTPRIQMMTGVILLSVALGGCSEDRLSFVQGQLKVTAINAPERARSILVSLDGPATNEDQVASVAYPETIVVYDRLSPGTWKVLIRTRDTTGAQLQSFTVSQVLVRAEQMTEIIVDLADPPPVYPETCDGIDNDRDGETDEGLDLPICTACIDGHEANLEDDARCGSIGCSEFNSFTLRGDNTPEGSSTCVALEHPAIESNRCIGPGACVTATAETCAATSERVVASANLCRTIEGCENGNANVVVSADGTPCGGENTCRGGDCLPPDPPPPPPPVHVGCADGEREGFLDTARYPDIAACSGSWSVPGVTRDNMVPTCGNDSGDDSNNPGGSGCAAVDLCEPGWHICLGKDEVALRAGTCDDATPPNAPSKSLFFAVTQQSANGSACDQPGDNDVFGCGNLGTVLDGAKHCAPLTRVLASTAPGGCGYNEAEPPLGPWECPGDSTSHLHEGALVTKDACVNASCSYDGNAISTQDKGGVLCCRD